jgi:hypothetical protein
MVNTDTVKILIIDSAQTPIHTEKYELPASQPADIKNLILKSLNRLGKGTHALIKYKDDYFVADHTAQGKVESESYYRHKVKYHPYMKELV